MLIQIAIGIIVLAVIIFLVRWQSDFLSGIWNDGGRGQFLVLGMPAVILLVLGVGAVGLAAISRENLDAQYVNLAQRANEKARRLAGEINSDDNRAPNQSLVDQDDERRKELIDEQKKEEIFLQKLIELDGNNPEHKFKLAMLAFSRGNKNRGVNLMQLIAPFDEPGYSKAHLFLAQHFLGEYVGSGAKERKAINLKRAELQIDNCLIAEEANVQAKRIKAFILDKQGKLLPAYNVYKELFEVEPIHYQELLRLAKALNKGDERKSFLDQASYQFRQLVNKSTDNVSDWVDAWTHYVICMKKKQTIKAYDEAENNVKGELLKFEDDAGKKVFLKRQLSRIYSERAAFRGRDAPLNVMKLQLSDLAKAIQNDKKNHSALQWLTMLSTKDEIEEEVKKIYDPEFDPNPPGVVLSELGHDALRNEQFEKAIEYFQLARKQSPRDPHVLNNLAFALLVAKNRNPEQALLLVDQAIAILQRTKITSNRENIISSFFDTRGEALMQLDRMQEAAASFEVAFQHRPSSIEIVEKLITCYEQAGNTRQAEAYRRRLEKLKKINDQSPASGDRN